MRKRHRIALTLATALLSAVMLIIGNAQEEYTSFDPHSMDRWNVEALAVPASLHLSPYRTAE